MGFYKYVKKLWQSPKKNLNDVYKQKLVQWRKEPVTIRLEHPTRIDRARSLGYKAKQGYFVVRQRVIRGGKTTPQVAGGRRPKKFSLRSQMNISGQTVAERRVARKYVNCEILNSYYVGKDGKHYYYEVIVVDPNHPVIAKDPKTKWLKDANSRVFRGKTSSQRKTRGLRHKGIGAEKVRPSARAKGGKLH